MQNIDWISQIGISKSSNFTHIQSILCVCLCKQPNLMSMRVNMHRLLRPIDRRRAPERTRVSRQKACPMPTTTNNRMPIVWWAYTNRGLTNVRQQTLIKSHSLLKRDSEIFNFVRAWWRSFAHRSIHLRMLVILSFVAAHHYDWYRYVLSTVFMLAIAYQGGSNSSGNFKGSSQRKMQETEIVWEEQK